MQAHGEDLREAGASEALVQALKRDPARVRLEPRHSSLRDLAIQLTLQPSSIDKRHVNGLRRVGMGDQEILEAVEVIAYFNYINRIADGLGIDPEPEWQQDPFPLRRTRRAGRSTLQVARGLVPSSRRQRLTRGSKA